MASSQELIIWLTDQETAGNRTGIESDINSEYLIYQPTDAPTSGLLATYTGAAAAYSVRQLSDKAVIALRIRRDSDDEEINIGFDANGDLDTTAISDFCDTANGYVTRWWDQSTNGVHADQATDASQPQIYNGTAVITENGKPAVEFTSSNLQISITQSASNYAASIVERRPSTQSGWLFDSQSGRLILDSRTNSLYFDGTFRGNDINSTSQDLVFLSLVSPSSGAGYVNGTAYDTGLSYTQKSLGGTTRLGSAYVESATVLGTIQEFVLWPSDQSSNRTGIESDINTYFSIY
jgi:hypothetical protein